MAEVKAADPAHWLQCQHGQVGRRDEARIRWAGQSCIEASCRQANSSSDFRRA